MIYIAIIGFILSTVALFAHIAGIAKGVKVERNIDERVLDRIRKGGR